jgi:hypothetical protein
MTRIGLSLDTQCHALSDELGADTQCPDTARYFLTMYLPAETSQKMLQEAYVI